jgi:Tol biopolymer transport system component
VRRRSPRRSAVRLGLLLIASALGFGLADPSAQATPERPGPHTSLVSVGLHGAGAAGQSYAPAISADGRYVAFDSDADNLVAGDKNGHNDVFVRDRVAGITTLVSTDSNGKQGDAGSFTPSISGDGRYVAFVSDADNLVPGDTNKASDVFLKDLRTGRTTRLSVAIDGRQTTGGSSPQISRDGRYVVYNVGTPLRANGTDEDLAGMFVHEIATGTRERLDHIEGDDPTISADGRYVAFHSEIRDLVPNDTNRRNDCFVFDRHTRHTIRVSLGGTRPLGHGWYAGNQQGNGESSGAVVSADGHYVLFVSAATNLVPGDTNATDDIFLRDLRTGATRRVNVSAHGAQADHVSGGGVLSADARYVVFLSMAGNLVPTDHGGHGYDVFRADLRDGSIEQVNVAPDGAQAGGTTSSFPAISADGRVVAFGSRADNLVAGKPDGHDRIFVRVFP